MGKTKQDWPERLKAKYADRVLTISDERGQNQGVWFELKAGWVTDEPTHQVHEETEARADSALEDVTKTCDCDSCKAGSLMEKAMAETPPRKLSIREALELVWSSEEKV